MPYKYVYIRHCFEYVIYVILQPQSRHVICRRTTAIDMMHTLPLQHNIFTYVNNTVTYQEQDYEYRFITMVNTHSRDYILTYRRI